MNTTKQYTNTTVNVFTFGPFQENSYIISNNKDNTCWIIDPGCYSNQEEQILTQFVAQHQLKPVKLINTHCHLDHIYGNKLVADTYQLELGIHQNELPMLKGASMAAQMYGLKVPPVCEPSYFIAAGDTLQMGDVSFKVLFTPGHSPGSICFYNETDKYIIVGDVLFYESIGRTDLPMGDYDTLISSIKTQLYTLPNAVEVYNGHGINTTIEHEKKNNPFVRGI